MVLKKSLIIMVLAVLVCFAGTPTMAEADNKEVRLGYLVADQLHGAAFMVMKENKLLEKLGYTVKWSEYLSGGYLMQDMAAGAIDFGVGGMIPGLITHAQGINVAILASGNTEGSSIVVGDHIKSIKDLDGKKIGTPGIGTMQDAMVAQVAADNNIRIMRMNIKVSDMPLFLQKKEIDGFCAWAPHPARTIALGYGHQLLTSRDIVPGHQCCVLMTLLKTLEGDPQLAKDVVKTYLEAYQWFLDNKEEGIAMVVKATGMEDAIVREAIKSVQYPVPPFCHLPSMKTMAKGLIETDKITTVKVDQIEAFINGIYHPALVEELTGEKAPR